MLSPNDYAAEENNEKADKRRVRPSDPAPTDDSYLDQAANHTSRQHAAVDTDVRLAVAQEPHADAHGRPSKRERRLPHMAKAS